MAEILTPGLELFRRPAQLLPKLHQSVAERVRIEIGQARADKCLPEDLPYGFGIGPEGRLQSINNE
jgi:hypothetical protein